MGKQPYHDFTFMTVREFMEWARIGRTKTYEEIAAGRLEAVKVGRKTLIPPGAAGNWARNQKRIIWVSEDAFGKGPPDGP